jgi:hypothetical protein
MACMFDPRPEIKIATLVFLIIILLIFTQQLKLDYKSRPAALQLAL